jgi:hypothetical protein
MATSSRSFTFELAQPSDDAELRALARSLPMDGAVRLALHREPDFFAAERIGAQSVDVIVARERDGGRIVGYGTRSIRRAFVNGQPVDVGYLSSLRGLPEVRRGTLLARGYRALRELHRDGKTPFYYSTIFEDNRQARELLTSGRAGLPLYDEVGRMHTYAIDTGSCRPECWPTSGATVVRGSPGRLEAIVDLLNTSNRRYQFSPCYTPSDFQNTRLLPGFTPEHFYVATRGDLLVGAAGLWDQRTIRQSVVDAYTGPLAWLRPFYNFYASMARAPRYPRAGRPLRACYAAFLAVDPPDGRVLLDLLKMMLTEPREPAYEYLLLGLCDGHPLAESLSNVAARIVTSRIFLVYWGDDRARVPQLDPQPPFLELATS